MPHDGPTVLVAENDQLIAALLEDLLQDAGYRVEHVAEAAAVLPSIQNGGIDCALLDLRMNDGNGLEVCRQVRVLEKTPADHLPIILLTAVGEGGALEAGMAARADDYVTKPFDIEDLLARICRLLCPDAD